MSKNLLVLDPSMRVSIRQAAEVFGVSAQWIRDLGKQGYVDGIERGSVPLVAVIKGYATFKGDDDRRASRTAAAADVQKARAEEIRLRIAREQGHLIETNAAVAAFSDTLGTLRFELEGVAAAATRDLATRERIAALQNEAFGRAQKKFAAKRAALQAKAKGAKK